MTREVAEKIARGIADKIECNTADIDDWAEFWGFTSDEYEEFLDMAIKALEQEPKSEWEQDHELLKAYSDGANDVLEKIEAEIVALDIFYDNDYFVGNREPMFKCDDILQILDKYKGGSEVEHE